MYAFELARRYICLDVFADVCGVMGSVWVFPSVSLISYMGKFVSQYNRYLLATFVKVCRYLAVDTGW